MIYRTLLKSEYDKYQAHLLRLDDESRYKRFAANASNDYIKNYIKKISEDDFVIGAFELDKMVGALHFCVDLKNKIGEIGISVDKKYRNNGIASRLLKKAIRKAKSKKIEKLFMMCIHNNVDMIKLANKINADVSRDGTEVYANLNIKKEKTDDFDIIQEFLEENQETFLFYQQQKVKLILNLFSPFISLSERKSIILQLVKP